MVPASVLFAFGFAHLPMLGWLAAAALPLLLHLWHRRRYREVPWSAMEYLLAAARQRARRLRLENWLLLLVRTLLIVLVVLAVAEPYWRKTRAALTPGVPTHRVLMFDGSYSMAYQTTNQNRFEKAKAAARRIVEESPVGDAFTLVLLSSPPRVVVRSATFESRELLAEIDNLPLPQVVADLPATVTALISLLHDVKRDNPQLTQHEVYFLTDLQRITWAPHAAATNSKFLREREELAEMAALNVVDFGPTATDNLAVTNLSALDAVPTVGHTVRFDVSLQNFTPQTRRQQIVDLLVDGRRVDQQRLDVPPHGAAQLAFSQQFLTAGDHTVEVHAPGDPLDVDNHRYLVVPVRDAIRVLCIDGQPSGKPFHGAADYLAAALTPQSTTVEPAPIRAATAAENVLLERNLAAYDCLCLCDVAKFTASEAHALDAYLRRGGNLIFFLGAHVAADNYNRELGVAAAGNVPEGETHAPTPRIAMLPAQLGKVVDQAEYRLDPRDYRHPVLQAFRGRGQTSLLTTPVFKHYALTLPPASAAQTILALSNGDPLIVAQPVGHGRVVLVATSADKSWTALPLWPSFVPLCQELVRWCVGAQTEHCNVQVGAPLDLAWRLPDADAAVTLQTPDGRSRTIRPEGDGGVRQLRFTETSQSGIYKLQWGTPQPHSRSFAVNVDTVESDLAPVDLDILRTEVWPSLRLASSAIEPAAAGIGAVHTAPRHARLPIALLYAALVFLLSETLLAWHFGYRTR